MAKKEAVAENEVEPGEVSQKPSTVRTRKSRKKPPAVSKKKSPGVSSPPAVPASFPAAKKRGRPKKEKPAAKPEAPEAAQVLRKGHPEASGETLRPGLTTGASNDRIPLAVADHIFRRRGLKQ